MKTKKLVIIKNWDAVEDLFDEYIEGEPNVVRFKLDARGGKKHLKNAAGTKSMALISENDPVITAMRSHPLLDLLIVEDGLYGVLPHWRQTQDADGNYLTKPKIVDASWTELLWDDVIESGEVIGQTPRPVRDDNGDPVEPFEQAVTVHAETITIQVPDMEWYIPAESEASLIYKEIYPYHIAQQDTEGNERYLPPAFTCSSSKEAILFNSNTEWP